MVILAAPPKPDYLAAADLILGLPLALAEARAIRGLSVVEAAKEITVAPLTLTKLEAGTSKPTQDTIIDCLRWLGQ